MAQRRLHMTLIAGLLETRGEVYGPPAQAARWRCRCGARPAVAAGSGRDRLPFAPVGEDRLREYRRAVQRPVLLGWRLHLSRGQAVFVDLPGPSSQRME